MLASQNFLFNLNPQLLFDAALLAIAVFFLYLLMSYLLFNPARKLLKDRQDRIAAEIDDANADKESAAALKAEYEAKLKEVDKEAELEKKHAMDDMKQEMITVASLMAQKVMAASINTEIQSTLVDETLREMGESTWQS